MREVILIGGRSGTGKTTCLLQIAKAYPKSQFYYIDTDGSARRVWELEFPGVKNISYILAVDWKACHDAIKKVKTMALKPSDFVVLEMIDNLWTYDQQDFVLQVHGDDMSGYLMQRRLEMQSKGKKAIVSHTPQDWSIMTTRYLELLYILWYQTPAHFIATTSVSEPLPGLRESPKASEFYDSLEIDYGIRYDGHKENLYRFETHLLLAHDRKGFYLTTIKERGSRVRRPLSKVPLHNFVVQYLCPVAGFQIPEGV